MATKTLGFSLLELLIALTILAILTAIAIPALNLFKEYAEEDTLHSQLLRAIHLARTEAIARNTHVLLCGSSDHHTCVSQWNNAWLISTIDGHMIYLFQNLMMNGTLHWRAFPLNHTSLEFLPSGLPNAENGTFWFCHEKTNHAVFAIVLNQSGRVRTVYPNAEGEILDDKGVALVC
ncbi:MAG: type 4 fimbrial biogenesis protein FimT [uncultured bacterium]|nr:MAG: type 4 fimbrial biogenesis protein FimT [uncultured bacterium]